MFFDRPAVIDAIGKARAKVLGRFGARVRLRARRSMRRRKGVSVPGSPPHAHQGLLREKIEYHYDPRRESVVIGPVLTRAPSSPTVPELLEKGGVVRVRDRVIYVPTANGRDALGRFTARRHVAVLVNGAMRYRPRPYMRPALEAELPGLEGMWKDVVR